MQEKNELSIPMAIIGAGLIIGLVIFMTFHKSEPAPATNSDSKTSTISYKPVSNSDHILGDSTAPITLIEFSDLECPFCKTFEVTMNSLMQTYGKTSQLAWVYRHFPLNIHPKAPKEAEASECATELGGNDGFWKFTEGVFAITNSNNSLDEAKLPEIAKNIGLDVNKFNTCLSSGKYTATVNDQSNDALSAGARGTPYNILVLKKSLSSTAEANINSYIVANNFGQYVSILPSKKEIVVNGAVPLEFLKQVIEYILK